MLVKNEVELHPNSIYYIKETFSLYAEVEKLKTTVVNPIIHIYPKEDTYAANGELTGYIDALYIDVHVYDTETMTVWKGKKLYDGIMPFGSLHVSQIKAFKDLSTMIVLQGKYRVSGSFQAFDIEKIYKENTPLKNLT